MGDLAELDGGCGWGVVGYHREELWETLYKLWGGKIHDVVHVRYWMSCKSPEEQAS